MRLTREFKDIHSVGVGGGGFVVIQEHPGYHEIYITSPSPGNAGWLLAVREQPARPETPGRTYLTGTLTSLGAQGRLLTALPCSLGPGQQGNLEAAIELVLTCACMREEDTDSEYFDGYTEEQLQWTRSTNCEDLSQMLQEWRYLTGTGG